MCQVETSESLEGVFPGGLIKRCKNVLKRFDSLYKLPASSKFSGAWQVVGEIWQEVFLRRNLARGTHYGIGILCLTEAGEQQIDWVPEKDWNWQWRC